MATVALTIDYSNGAQKHFSSIPWKEGLTVLEAIQAIEGIPPKPRLRSDLIGPGTFSDSSSTKFPLKMDQHRNGLSGSTTKAFKVDLAPKRALGSIRMNARATSLTQGITSWSSLR